MIHASTFYVMDEVRSARASVVKSVENLATQIMVYKKGKMMKTFGVAVVRV